MAQTETAKRYRVLVVEDEGLIAHDIAARLETLGHEVAGTVSTAEEAIAQAGGADLVLMDIRIDGQRDGIEAATEIRARHHVPVIFLTAHADRSTLDRAKQAGPFGYIVKPLGPMSLQTGIEMGVAKHRVERLLEEREAWLRAAIASAGDGTIVTSADGHVRLLNRSAEKLTGWTQAEAEGKAVGKIAQFMLPDSEGSGEEMVSLALLRDAPIEFERGCRMISRDGREMEIEGSAAPVRAGQYLLGAVLIFRDASARRWEERQLRQAERLEAAGRLAASAARDYNNLIAVMRLRTDTLLRELAEFRPARAALEEIQETVFAAERITRRLEAFGTRQVSRAETFSVNGLLRRMERMIESAAGPSMRVAIRPSAGAGKVRADPAQLESAVLSVVNHAFGVLPEDGQVLIETARVDLAHSGRTVPYVLLSVTYSAIETEIERLFDPAAVTDAGLSLALVHSAVAEWGGDVAARSGPMGGSRIEILIPRAADQALPAGMWGGASDSPPAPAVLLIEKSEHLRQEIHNFFEASGMNLLESGDAEEAIALLELHEGNLDLVIADSADARRVSEFTEGSVRILRMVEGEEQGQSEIRRPFTELALWNKVAEALGRRAAPALTGSR